MILVRLSLSSVPQDRNLSWFGVVKYALLNSPGELSCIHCWTGAVCVAFVSLSLGDRYRAGALKGVLEKECVYWYNSEWLGSTLLCRSVAGICASTSLCLSVRKDRHKAYTSEGRWCHCYINVRAVCQWESVSLARPSRLTHRVSGSRRSARSTRRKAMYVCIRQTDQISRTIQTGIFNWR